MFPILRHMAVLSLVFALVFCVVFVGLADNPDDSAGATIGSAQITPIGVPSDDHRQLDNQHSRRIDDHLPLHAGGQTDSRPIAKSGNAVEARQRLHGRILQVQDTGEVVLSGQSLEGICKRTSGRFRSRTYVGCRSSHCT